MLRLLRSLAAVAAVAVVRGLSSADFYPFGLPAGDSVLALQDESASPEFQLVDAVTFYGVSYRSLFVNQNGLLSFGTEVPYFTNQELSKFAYSIIAPFYADVDTYNSDHPDVGNGHIYFREERTDSRLITGASKLISRSFRDAEFFVAQSLVIVTWDEVGYYQGKSDKRNSFQVVIASNETNSYAAFMYGSIQWIVSEGGKDSRPDAPAQVGFVADDGRHQTLVGSGTEDVQRLSELTNTEMPGLFLFRISGESPVDPRSTHAEIGNQLGEEGDEYETNDYIDDDEMDNRVPGSEGGGGNDLDDYYYDYPECPPNEHLFCPSSCRASTDAQGCPLCDCPHEPSSVPDAAYCSDPAKAYQDCGTGCPLGCDNLYSHPVACALQCASGCFCNESDGFVLHDSRLASSPCVRREQCPKPDLPLQPPSPDQRSGVEVPVPVPTVTVMAETEVDECEDPDKQFMECGSSCPLGCDNLYSPPPVCTMQCVRGCFCRESEGLVFHDARRWDSSPCVRREQCPRPDEEAAPAPPLTHHHHANPQSPGGEPSLARETRQTCDTLHCSPDAECRESGEGACCHCRPGTFGNGKECLKDGEPQRINGRFSGKVNGMPVAESDVHTYVVTTDGRAYTAVSQVPPSLGPSLVLLNAIGNVNGWLFAKVASPGAHNGFMLTGGVLNRSVTVHIGDSHTMTIKQEFGGKDIFHYFKAKVFVSGSMPVLAAGSEPQFKIDYEDFTQEFRRVSPGVLKSYSTPVLRVGTEEFRMTVDQTIRFDECPYNQADMDSNTLRVERSYGLYDRNEQIVRFASANMIQSGSGGGASDPCRAGAHTCTGPKQVCTPEGSHFRCLCTDGYEMGQGACVDLDECRRQIHGCDANADCHNSLGSYMCRCRSGFRGTGFRCIPEGAPETASGNCGGYTCANDAECLPAAQGGLECVCRAGFYGNGVSCQALPPTEATSAEVGPPCSSHEDCSPYGLCDWNDAIRQYQCRCRPPYSGDGVRCFREPATCDVEQNCDRNADCTFVRDDLGGAYKCICRQGFSGDGVNCVSLTQQAVVCASHEECGSDAMCEWSREGNRYECVCRPGLAGDGRDCRPTQAVECNVLNNCHPSAQCLLDSRSATHMCRCLSGFRGDGYTCTAEDGGRPPQRPQCRSQDDCHENAHCVIRDGEAEYSCECLPGFAGDGTSYCDSADECSPGQEAGVCSPQAQCQYQEARRAYVCLCREGYEGTGRECRPASGPPPGQYTCDRRPGMCHQDAQCVLNYEMNRHSCECLIGFSGDGERSCVRVEDDCSVHNNCHGDADCIRDFTTNRHFCKCQFGFIGDGSVCRPEVSCLEKPDMCDEEADCVPEEFSYVCRCRVGFHGNGRQCAGDSNLRGRSLVMGQGMSLVKRGLGSDEPGKQLVVVPFQIVVGIDFDCQEERLFWTDVSGHAIRSAAADGSNVTIVLGSDIVNSPEGIAVDWSSRNLYYADSAKDRIAVASLDGRHHLTLLKDGLVNPRAIAVDVKGRRLYYSDWNRERPLIGRMRLDGEEREDFVTTDISLPNDLVVLHGRQELCWSDAGRQRLECIGLDGRGRRVVHAPLPYPFGLTVRKEETFFLTDWEDKMLHSVSVHGGGHRTMPASIGGSGKLYGIVALAEECPPGGTECGVERGGCPETHLCLPRGSQGNHCRCPDNLDDPESCTRMSVRR